MRRRVLLVVVFLLVGAVVNVAVAWGVARWSVLFSGVQASIESNYAPSAWRLDNVPERWPDKPTVEVTYGRRWFLFTSQNSRLDDTKHFGVSLHELRFGVPTKSLAWYLLAENDSGTWTYSWRHAWGRLGGDDPLPLRPIWPGFAINTLSYAALLWLLIPGPFALRRLVRRRRGLCPACGYDLRHAEHQACPECGVTA